MVENKLEVATNIDNNYEKIDKLDRRIFAVAYAEGEKILKCYKKTTGWNALPEEEKVSQFDKYLKGLKFITLPSIKVITPKSGTFPFLKVTFMSGGDKKEFMNLTRI